MNDLINRNTISNKETKIKFNNNIESTKNISLGNLRQRKDSFGNPISKKNKNHKVTFIDQFEKQKLAEIKNVKSYRNYNKYVNTLEEGN